MNIQRLRNLTTGRMHTEMGHIYEDLEAITGEQGIMTHMLPRVRKAVEPWLRQHATDPRLWDGKFDQSHVGDYDLPIPSEEEREAMVERFNALPNPFDGKKGIVVQL